MARRTLTLGQALRKRRETLGLNQAEVADLLATTQGNLSRWERDLTEPREIDTYRAVSKFLEISLLQLVDLIAESARQRAFRELLLLQD